MKFDGLLLSKKYIHSAKTLHLDDLSILLSTTCSPDSQSPYVIFETTSHFSRRNSSVFFLPKHYIPLTKVAHQSANFQTYHWSC